MKDEQILRRKQIRKHLILSVMMLMLAAGLFYFRLSTQAGWESYKSDKSRESALQSQVAGLEEQNKTLTTTIEETGRRLVSFSEDKLKYINLASDLSVRFDVEINKLTVSDTWTEGQMTGMTTTLEIQGAPEDVNSFVSTYCSSDSANRVNSISYRPAESYAWVKRDIDGNRVLTWFDLKEEGADVATAAGKPVSSAGSEKNMEGDLAVADPVDPVTSRFSVESMFAEKTMKAYLVVDFLGRG